MHYYSQFNERKSEEGVGSFLVSVRPRRWRSWALATPSEGRCRDALLPEGSRLKPKESLVGGIEAYLGHWLPVGEDSGLLHH